MSSLPSSGSAAESGDLPSNLSTIIKAYDVRGLVPAELNPDIARAIGAAFADVTEGQNIVVGQDMRPSGDELVEAFADGINQRGKDVQRIGLCSTDGIYHASGSLNQPGAMFTASHNPAGYNGIKLCHAGARPVGQSTGLDDVRRLAERFLREGIPQSESAGTTHTIDTLVNYAQHLRNLVDLSGIRRLKVVIDAGNGMAGLTAPAVLGSQAGLDGLNLDIIPLYFELDGTFPNHEANPLEPANLVDLQAAVIEHQADLGLAFDGDADRCFVVDEKGQAVTPSAITALVGLREIESEKAAGRQAVVIHNLITSRAVPDFVTAAGATAVRTRVGHSFIKATMAENNAVFGGEHSAHFYFRDFWFADTGMLAAMHVLRALGQSEMSMSELAAIYSPYFASGEINSTVSDAAAALERIRREYAADIARGVVQVDELDGVTYSHWQSMPRWWFNVRRSNTEPLLRLNVEAEDEDIMEKLRDGVLQIIRKDETTSSEPDLGSQG